MNIETIIQKLVEIYAEQEGVKIKSIQIERRWEKMIVDAIACGLITIWQLIKCLATGLLTVLLVQVIIYYLSGKKISPLNIVIRRIKKEIYGSGKHMYTSK